MFELKTYNLFIQNCKVGTQIIDLYMDLSRDISIDLSMEPETVFKTKGNFTIIYQTTFLILPPRRVL